MVRNFCFSSRSRVYAAPITRWPNWVYEQYDARCLVEQVHRVLGTLRLFSQTQVWDFGTASCSLTILYSKYQITAEKNFHLKPKYIYLLKKRVMTHG